MRREPGPPPPARRRSSLSRDWVEADPGVEADQAEEGARPRPSVVEAVEGGSRLLVVVGAGEGAGHLRMAGVALSAHSWVVTGVERVPMLEEEAAAPEHLSVVEAGERALKSEEEVVAQEHL